MNKKCSPKKSLEQSLKEMKLMRKGKLPKTKWDDFRKNINRENQKS